MKARTNRRTLGHVGYLDPGERQALPQIGVRVKDRALPLCMESDSEGLTGLRGAPRFARRASGGSTVGPPGGGGGPQAGEIHIHQRAEVFRPERATSRPSGLDSVEAAKE